MTYLAFVLTVLLLLSLGANVWLYDQYRQARIVYYVIEALHRSLCGGEDETPDR